YTESVKRNVGTSADLLKAAQARLVKMKEDTGNPLPPVKADPVVKFREKWDPLLRDGRYKTARALIDKEGQELTDDQRTPFVSRAAAPAASAALEERFENPWFKAVEGSIFLSLKSAIGAEVDRARDAGKADRDKARALADGYLAIWKGMTAKLDPKFIERHRFL